MQKLTVQLLEIKSTQLSLLIADGPFSLLPKPL